MVNLEELVKKYYAAVDAGDLETLFSVFADDIVYKRPGYEPLVGMEKFQEFYKSNRVIKEGHHTLSNIVVKDPYVIVEGEFNGILKDGKKSHTTFVDVYTFSKGKATKRHTYFDGQNV
ncbi:nuclear transport factor 2 family protein [Ferroplasma sp.]|uniref:nuclear transport factor 2 family protein n=1 Tax=Ferroplasma sp. TaxID=2591003 RepID=UPI00307E345F